MDRVDEILFLYEDDVVEMADGGRIGFKKAGLAHPNRKTLTAKEKKLIDDYEKRTGLKYTDQSGAQQWKIRNNPNTGRNQAMDAGKFSKEVQARIKKYQKEYDEGTAARRADIRSGKFTGKQLGFKKIDDPERLQAIKDYVKKFEKEKGVLPTKNEIRKHFKKTTGSDPGKSVTLLVERGELKDLPTGYGMKSSSIVDDDVKKLLKNKNIIDTLDSGKFPTISQIKNILKVDPTIAEVRAIDLGQTLAGNRDIRFYKAPTKYKKLSQNYLDRSTGSMFKATGSKSRAYYEKGLTKLLNLPKNIYKIREDIVNKIANIVPELKGMINVDEVASLTASMRRGSGPYAIFGQVLGSDFNQHVKGLGIDKAKSFLEKKLTTDFLKGDPQRLIEQEKYNKKVEKFEADANKNNPAKKVKGLKLSFEPPSKTIKNKKIYNQYKDLFDAHYAKTGYSFEVPADRDSIVDISKKLDNPGFQNTIKNRFKKLIGKGGKIGALAGMGTLAASGFALADEALAADGTEARSILPEVAGGAAAGSLAFKPVRQGVKKGLKATGRLLGKLAVPIGLGAEAYFAKQAYDEGKSIPEIMAAPFLLDSKVRQAQDMLRMKPEERQAVNREMIEEDFSGLSSDFDTPTLEGVDDVDIEEVKERVLQERLADEARRREERKASGGIAGLSGGIDEGPPPESGPNPQGLENLKYYVTNT